MIDISKKDSILRIATSSGKIYLKKETIERIKNKNVKKGDVFTIAKIAAINAVKKVPDLIPLCHSIPISNVDIDFTYEGDNIIRVRCIVKKKKK
ncbi:MAG: cyclic pyranopterin monophosphate synthase MoaC, partial [Promethearchaeota archaeon]